MDADQTVWEEKTFEDLTAILGRHLQPKPSVLAERKNVTNFNKGNRKPARILRSFFFYVYVPVLKKMRYSSSSFSSSGSVYCDFSIACHNSANVRFLAKLQTDRLGSKTQELIDWLIDLQVGSTSYHVKVRMH